MTPIDKLVLVVEAALDKYTESLFDHDSAHEAFCLCHRCVFVRGIRAELAAFEKAEKRAKK